MCAGGGGQCKFVGGMSVGYVVCLVVVVGSMRRTIRVIYRRVDSL